MPNALEKKLRVLVVDDSEGILRAAVRKLTKDGYEAITATGATEAIGLLGSKDPEIILSDVNMPLGSLDQLVIWLRANKRHLIHRLIVMSGGLFALKELVEGLQDEGVPLINKPFEDGEPMATIAKVLEKVRVGVESAVGAGVQGEEADLEPRMELESTEENPVVQPGQPSPGYKLDPGTAQGDNDPSEGGK